MSAHVTERHYSNGEPFYIVICAECCTALNSGHHYGPNQVHHAIALADDHNAKNHEMEI